MKRHIQEERHFSFLTAVGIIFALTLCLLASAMVYVAFPSSTPLLKLVFEGSGKTILVGTSMDNGLEATPFQPVILEDQQIETPALSTPTPIPISLPTATPEPKPEPTPIPQEAPEQPQEPDLSNLPASAYISGVTGYPQYYTLDCEAQAAVDFARFFGLEIDRQEFIDKMPRSDDPEEGFVGEINGPMGQLPPDDYGVHAKPVAKLLREYGLKAKAVRGWSLDQVRAEIAAGRPVIAWIVNLPFDIEVQEYTASNGKTTRVARFEHTWIITGYNMNSFTVVDSEWTYNVKISTFKSRWQALGSQAIVYRGEQF